MSEYRLLLIDGHSMAFRAFYALPADSFRNNAGQYTNAVHGFTNTLLHLIKEYDPTHVAVAFDLPGGTFRSRKYDAYKAGRKKTPEEFKGQIELIRQLLDAVGIRWFTVEDYEADDIVASFAVQGEKRGMRVFIASGDKDSYQLITDRVSVVYPMPRSRMQLLTPEKIAEKTGVLPGEYSDMAALVGEGADNLPGVPGVGPKTAAKWIKKYRNLNEIISHAEEIKGKAGESLRAHIPQVMLNRELNRLVTDLHPVGDFGELIPRGVDRPVFNRLCDLLEFSSVRAKVLRTLPVRDGGEDPAQSPAADAPAIREIRLLTHEEAAPADFLRRSEKIWGLAVGGVFSPGRGVAGKIAVAAENGDVILFSPQETDEADRRAIRSWLADPNARKAVHGGKALRHALFACDLEITGICTDTEIQAYLLHPDSRSYEFNELTERYLGTVPEEHDPGTLDISPCGTLGGSDASLVFAAVRVLDLADVFDARLAQNEHSGLLLEMELNAGEVLARMEDRGIAVDRPRLEKLISDFDDGAAAARQEAYNAIGDDSVNLMSPKQLQEVLFTQLELPHTKKTATGYTTNAQALRQLLEKIAFREDDAAIRGQNFLSALLQYRDAVKLLQSAEGLQKAICADGRIHTTYQQTVAATGRLSSTDPNLQNIHARTEEGKQIREIFVPGSGYDLLLTADYSQIEMRLMAHLSGDAELIAAFNHGDDLHKYVAGKVFSIPPGQVSPQQRTKIKAVSYGLAYGLSAYGLSERLRIPVFEARNLMKEYFARFGNVKHYLDSLVEKARKKGYTETMFGRRRYLPDLLSENRRLREAAERMALNAPIQGSAADIMKIAMTDTEAELRRQNLASRILLQVHDELVLEIKARERETVERIVREKMGHAVNLDVPLTVGMGVGKNWRAAAH